VSLQKIITLVTELGSENKHTQSSDRHYSRFYKPVGDWFARLHDMTVMTSCCHKTS